MDKCGEHRGWLANDEEFVLAKIIETESEHTELE